MSVKKKTTQKDFDRDMEKLTNKEDSRRYILSQNLTYKEICMRLECLKDKNGIIDNLVVNHCTISEVPEDIYYYEMKPDSTHHFLGYQITENHNLNLNRFSHTKPEPTVIGETHRQLVIRLNNEIGDRILDQKWIIEKLEAHRYHIYILYTLLALVIIFK